jgi:glycosyltransferase involved in cell wall biosynthesis
MNILELCLSPDFGGLEMFFRDYSAWLYRQPEVSLSLCIQRQSRIEEAIRDFPVNKFLLSGMANRFPLSKTIRLAGFIRKNKIDVIHVHWKYDLDLVVMAKHLCWRPVKIIYSRLMSLPDRKFDPYHWYIYGSIDRIVAITKNLEQQVRRNLPLGDEKIVQIYLGFEIQNKIEESRIDELKRQYKIDGSFNIGLFGRISEYKGQHLLIEAIEKLRNENVVVKGWIIGEAFEPNYLDSLKEMVWSKNLSAQVNFLDFYPNPVELMSCFDTVLLTTRSETFGLVLIEAMHAGVAVIGSDAGGVPEIIDHEKTGLLFEPNNAESLAKVIKRLFMDEPFRRKIAHAGQRKAKEKFDRNIQFQKTLQEMKTLSPE